MAPDMGMACLEAGHCPALAGQGQDVCTGTEPVKLRSDVLHYVQAMHSYTQSP